MDPGTWIKPRRKLERTEMLRILEGTERSVLDGTIQGEILTELGNEGSTKSQKHRTRLRKTLIQQGESQENLSDERVLFCFGFSF